MFLTKVISVCILLSEASTRWVKAAGRGPIQWDRATPKDQNALLMQTMEDFSLRQSWRLTNVLFKVRNGGLSQRDVKNEGTSGDVYENKGTRDIMSGNRDGFLAENAEIAR
jgi:hypothetical protein